MSATLLFHKCSSCVTKVSQKRLNVKGFQSIFSRKNTKLKNLKAFHECNKRITDGASYVKCVLQFSSKSGFRYNFVLRFDFRNVFVMFRICIFLHFNSFQCINRKRNTQILCFLSVARCPQPHFRNKKGKAAAKCSRPASSGSARNFPLSSLCLITVQQKRRAAPKSRPPTIQAMLLKKMLQAITEQPLLPRSA